MSFFALAIQALFAAFTHEPISAVVDLGNDGAAHVAIAPGNSQPVMTITPHPTVASAEQAASDTLITSIASGASTQDTEKAVGAALAGQATEIADDELNKVASGSPAIESALATGAEAAISAAVSGDSTQQVEQAAEGVALGNLLAPSASQAQIPEAAPATEVAPAV